MSATPAVQDLKASVPQAKGDETEERVPIELTVAPGRTVVARLPRSVIGRVGVVTLALDETGKVQVIWESFSAMIRLTEDFAERTGIPASRNMVKTWMLAGFVSGKAVLNSTWVDLTSLKRFLDQISVPQAREFWTEERQQRYLAAKAEVYSSGLKARVRRDKSGSAVMDDDDDDDDDTPLVRAEQPTFDFWGDAEGGKPTPEAAA